MKKRTLQQVLQSLTLEEKAAMLSGRDFWRTKQLLHKGIPSLRMADGPHGVRREAVLQQKKNGGRSLPAICYPTASALACAWNTRLCEEIGEALGQESAEQGVHVLLGPGVNMKRSPLCGRSFEYFSEDPLLAGKLAAAYIRGVEREGVGTSLKHYAMNNQENYRMRVSAEVDERTLRELYLRPFEIAVQEGRPATVMASYNRVNGTHATENEMLLQTILREEWGFQGAVISDWGALNDRVRAVRAGLDLEMPASGGETDRQLVQAVREGRLKEQELDRCCLRVLKLVYRYLQAEHTKQPNSKEQRRQLAKRAALQSAVLMKNDGILPLSQKENLAVIGGLAYRTRFQGAGSSLVNAYGVSFVNAMYHAGHAYLNGAHGYRLNDPRPCTSMEQRAVDYARTANTVLYFMGLTELFESEGYDRTHLRLPDNQVKLLDKLLQVNSNIVVVLVGGAPVEMPWADRVRAVLYAGLGGEQIGPALYDLIFGLETPSGKLAETWPLKLGDVPCAHCFPMGPRIVEHREGIYAGYRYYDKAQQAVRYPFGHGLSYTSFAYSELTCDVMMQSECMVRVNVTVHNTGKCAGDEIVQIYVSKRGSMVHRPVRVLAGFARVALQPSEAKRVSIVIHPRELAVWDTRRGRFVIEHGIYEIWAGSSSRTLPLSQEVFLSGELITPSEGQGVDGAYGKFCDNRFTQDQFLQVHHRAAQSNTPLKPGQYTMETTLGEMRASATARMLERIAVRAALYGLRFSTNPAVNRRVCKTAVRDLPFKNIAFNLGGAISFAQLEKLLKLCNASKAIAAPKPKDMVEKNNKNCRG